MGALAALCSFLVYLPRLAPTLTLLGDSAVFVSSAATMGVPQPSGYPLWTTLGFLFSKLPVRELPWRVHLSSAVFHALTVFVVAWLITRVTRSRLAGLAGALCLAFSRAFFLGSLYAEVFPLNDLFTALALAAGVELYLQRDEGDAAVDRALGWLALISGLASAHHQTIALLAPALALLVWRARALGRIRVRLRGLLLRFCAPIVLFYTVLAVAASRDPYSSWGDVHTFDALIDLFTRQDYGGMTSPHLGGKAVESSELATAWFDGQGLSFGPLVAVAVWGAIAGFRRGPDERPIAAALALAVLVSGPVFAVMNALEVDTEHGRAFAERFSTMSAVPVGVLVGLGIAALRSGFSTWFPPVLLRLALGLLFLLPLTRHGRACDLRHDRRGLQVAHDVANVPDGSLVLISGDALNGAGLYACGVERRCGRTVIFSPGQMHLAWRVAQLRRRHPDLVLPPPTGKFLTVRELVAANASLRKVYLSAQILDLEPPLREMFDFLPEGIHVRALLPDDVAAFKASFPERARAFARGEGCEGCSMKRADLFAPSLETSLPFLYAIAFENHARVLSAFQVEPGLAASFAARAEEADPEGIRKLRAGR